MFSVLAVFALAGCSSATGGQPAPVPSAAQPSASAPASSAAGTDVPKVQNPIDTSKVAADPCSVLTPDQVSYFIGGPVSPDKNKSAVGPSCSWSGNVQYDYASIDVILDTVHKDGMTSVYAAKGKAYKFFQPLPAADGYPLVAYDTKEARTPGECAASLGVRDDQTLEVTIRQPDSRKEVNNPCDSAHAVAVAIIGNIRGGQ